MTQLNATSSEVLATAKSVLSFLQDAQRTMSEAQRLGYGDRLGDLPSRAASLISTISGAIPAPTFTVDLAIQFSAPDQATADAIKAYVESLAPTVGTRFSGAAVADSSVAVFANDD